MFGTKVEMANRKLWSLDTTNMYSFTHSCPRSQLPFQLDSVHDGSAATKSASKLFVPFSAAMSARVEKVVSKIQTEEAMTVSKCLALCPNAKKQGQSRGE